MDSTLFSASEARRHGGGRGSQVLETDEVKQVQKRTQLRHDRRKKKKKLPGPDALQFMVGIKGKKKPTTIYSTDSNNNEFADACWQPAGELPSSLRISRRPSGGKLRLFDFICAGQTRDVANF